MLASVDGPLRDKARPSLLPLLPPGVVERAVTLTLAAPPGERPPSSRSSTPSIASLPRAPSVGFSPLGSSQPKTTTGIRQHLGCVAFDQIARDLGEVVVEEHDFPVVVAHQEGAQHV